MELFCRAYETLPQRLCVRP